MPSGGPVLVKAHLQVPVGATLVIDGRTPDVRLTSTTAGFATIISRGTVKVAGEVNRPVRISSWDPELQQADGDSADGRSFLLQIGGRMDAAHGVFEYLGFNVGTSSGVAWIEAGTSDNQAEPVKAQGEVTSSVFLHNHFGAYTHQAQGMRWMGNTFADNEEYGFDPHDLSNNFVVEGNLAQRNGKHGFILSRGCDNNILRGNLAYNNAGHGFMIDDGRSLQSDVAEARINGSNNNLMESNVAYGNAGSGVEIEGGTENIVADNRLIGNYIGVRIKDNAAVTVRDNTIAKNTRYGIDVLDSAGASAVTGNTIVGSWGAVSLLTNNSAVLSANTATDVSTSLVVAGVAVHETTWAERIAAFIRWNPMLVIWSLVLGAPIVVAVLRFVLKAAKARRHRVVVT